MHNYTAAAHWQEGTLRAKFGLVIWNRIQTDAYTSQMAKT